MSDPRQLFWIYLAAALAVGVIVAALAAALVIYQRHSLRLHRLYAKKLLEAHEEERAWVAREVHDDALQRLALLQHELAEWNSGEFPATAGPAPAALRVDALRSELQDLGVMLRRVAHRLHPAIIDQAGLHPAMAQLASDVSRSSGIEIETALEDEPRTARLSRERALMLYRIVQEGLRNVVKHSRARRARVTLRAPGRDVVVTIEDAGTGFAATDPASSKGLGLISMAERAALADGRFEISSRPGQGTTIRVSVPVES